MKGRAVNIVIGGEAGQGLVTVGSLISRALVRSGFHICVTQSYLSRIRGGHNTFAWYKKRCRPLPEAHDPRNWEVAMKAAWEWGDVIPVGVLYENDRPAFEERVGVLRKGSPVGASVSAQALWSIMESYA